MKETVAFDDVLLEPVYSEVRSRLDVDTSTSIGGRILKIPLISSPMDTVTEAEMAIALGRFGGMGVLHRFMPKEKQAEILNKIAYLADPRIPLIPAIGVTSSEKDRFLYLLKRVEVSLDMISIDIANGHHVLMKEMIPFVKDAAPNLRIMAGNVATGEGYKFLADLGVDAVRVGIGGGSICKTRIQTGFGIPTLTSVIDCAAARSHRNYEASIIADGGIKYPADLVKSLVAGADAVIAGSLFAGTKEAPGDIIYTNDEKAWKQYRGMASAEVQKDRRGGMKPGTVAEGVSQLTPYKGSLDRVVNEFVGGLRSGMAYANAPTIPDLRKVKMVKITSSGVSESHAHGTRRR